MFVRVTYQDWLKAENKSKLLISIITQYKASSDFLNGLDANAYFAGENPTIAKKTILRADCTETKEDSGKVRKRWITKDVVGNRVGSQFFFRFIVQENQHLLSNGVTLKDAELKERLGMGFDKALSDIGENALKNGVCWGYWNVDHIECIPAVKDSYSGAVALLDEVTGVPMVLVQFWQLAIDRPLNVRLFEMDGVSVLQQRDGGFAVIDEKKPYIRSVATDALGEMVISESNYDVLPVFPLYANAEKRSELTSSIRAKIDLYDKVMSDFGDNLDRANDVYWVLNNFGGTDSDIAAMIEQINRIKAVVNVTDGTGSSSTAEPRTIEVPYAARSAALELLKKALYEDFMAVDDANITGGSLTNVAIKAAMMSLDRKCDRYEWQVFQFVQKVLHLIGVDTEEIKFIRQSIVNEQEVVQMVQLMRNDIDLETALRMYPRIDQEQIPAIIAAKRAEGVGFASVDELQDEIDKESDDAD